MENEWRAGNETTTTTRVLFEVFQVLDNHVEILSCVGV